MHLPEGNLGRALQARDPEDGGFEADHSKVDAAAEAEGERTQETGGQSAGEEMSSWVLLGE